METATSLAAFVVNSVVVEWPTLTFAVEIVVVERLDFLEKVYVELATV